VSQKRRGHNQKLFFAYANDIFLPQQSKIFVVFHVHFLYTAHMLTQERLKHLVLYDPVSGAFTWRNPTSKKYAPGGPIASVGCGGYLRVGLDSRRYLLHRLAWMYIYGVFPDVEIDHINQIRSDNRLENLRLATRMQNAQNVLMRSNNKSGAKGVSWDVDRKRWRAQININGKRRYLGLFDSVESASAAYTAAANKHHTHRAKR
jgi:hypothetical protein